MPEKDTITKTEVRMYKMGTGDCFAIKFYAGDKVSFKLMIDCGTWSGKKAHLEKYVKDLKTWFESEIDLLVVTHEHKDHVYGFEACEQLFTEGFEIKQTWLGWTEDDQNPTVQDWMKSYGQKKLALARATERIRSFVGEELNEFAYEHELHFQGIISSRKSFADRLGDLADFQFSLKDGQYVGNLKGMAIVKEKLAAGKIVFKEPGIVIRDLAGLSGVNIYVLGPPKQWSSVKKENGGKGESYEHNKELYKSDAFAAAILSSGENDSELSPFHGRYIVNSSADPRTWEICSRNYKDGDNDWRNIDFDWLMGAGELALRVSSMTNNLSLALAFEFESSKKVMLFPGDAEYGSWASWHGIPWDASVPRVKNPDHSEKGVVEDLLNRTVFYKVAHHLSHNGTARRLGLEMMNHPELVAMATLDYDVISDGWTSTIPNVGLIEELVNRTRGRLMVMNESGLLANRKTMETLTHRIERGKSALNKDQRTDFEKKLKVEDLYIQYTIQV